MVDVQTIGVLVTAASVSVAAIYYIFTLRINMKTQELTLKTQQQNLETRQAQLFMQVYNRVTESDIINNYFNIMETKFQNYDEFKQKILDDPIKLRSLYSIAAFYEGIGVLVKDGLVDIRFVAKLTAGAIRQFWEKLEPVIGETRRSLEYPRLLGETEYLYKYLMKYMATHPELLT